MDKSKELEALSITCDALANACDGCDDLVVSVEQLGDVLCCLKRVTNALDLDWDDVQKHSYEVNESINNLKENTEDGK